MNTPTNRTKASATPEERTISTPSAATRFAYGRKLQEQADVATSNGVQIGGSTATMKRRYDINEVARLLGFYPGWQDHNNPEVD